MFSSCLSFQFFMVQLYYWVGQQVCSILFHKIKDVLFIFTNNLIDSDILSILATSCMVEHLLLSINFSIWSLVGLQLICLTLKHCPVRNLQHKTSQTTVDTFDQSQHLLHTLHKFLCFSCVFTSLKIIKHHMLKMLHIFFCFLRFYLFIFRER